MAALRNSRLLLLVIALLVGSAVWAASTVQRNDADHARARQADAEALLTGMLDQETGLRGYVITAQPSFLKPYTDGRREYSEARASLDDLDDARARSLLRAVDVVARDWQSSAQRAVSSVRSNGARSVGMVAKTLARKRGFDRFRAAEQRLLDRLNEVRLSEAREAGLILAGVSLLIALLVGLIGDLVLGRRDRAERLRRRNEARYRETQSEFIETMQLAESEHEANDLLRHHLERSLPGAQVVVLNRNNSADRLEPATRVADAELAQRLEGAKPASCLAVRLGRAHARAQDEDRLMTCEVCGATPGSTTCRPVLVGSEVIGSVLVTHEAALDDQQRDRVSDSVAQAAPALANLRNLALAEMRAATDALTGLPNRRAIEDTLKRMIAQASRTGHALSALMVDVDHFKTINDLYGHELGDEALASLGALLRDCLRAGDFAGRQGGEEFIVLAAATDASDAATLAENLRRAIAQMRIPGLDHTVTASIGVATFPHVAASAAGLVRMADRALYAAKERGRNRVEVASGVGGSTAKAAAAD